ncbi:unnamed protein product [Chilo suppressalis]|uniref:FLYWCH-type domain-containing protein n=1 Tax=Chilo suppressalis TaxID=168631 RepID=A0ABN8B075_CHISP|nr:unnamed protein product [Chilo suppressalis]
MSVPLDYTIKDLTVKSQVLCTYDHEIDIHFVFSAEVIITKRGFKYLLVNGYTYCRNVVSENKIRWRCSDRKCSARVHTVEGKPPCANRHSIVPEDAVSTPELVYPNGYRFFSKYGQAKRMTANARIYHTNICPHRDSNPGPLESATPLNPAYKPLGQGAEEITTKRGFKILLINGYTYCRKNVSENKIRWRCSDRKCSARVHTVEGKVTLLMENHNHPKKFRENACRISRRLRRGYVGLSSVDSSNVGLLDESSESYPLKTQRHIPGSELPGHLLERPSGPSRAEKAQEREAFPQTGDTGIRRTNALYICVTLVLISKTNTLSEVAPLHKPHQLYCWFHIDGKGLVCLNRLHPIPAPGPSSMESSSYRPVSCHRLLQYQSAQVDLALWHIDGGKGPAYDIVKELQAVKRLRFGHYDQIIYLQNHNDNNEQPGNDILCNSNEPTQSQATSPTVIHDAIGADELHQEGEEVGDSRAIRSRADTTPAHDGDQSVRVSPLASPSRVTITRGVRLPMLSDDDDGACEPSPPSSTPSKVTMTRGGRHRIRSDSADNFYEAEYWSL